MKYVKTKDALIVMSNGITKQIPNNSEHYETIYEALKDGNDEFVSTFVLDKFIYHDDEIDIDDNVVFFNGEYKTIKYLNDMFNNSKYLKGFSSKSLALFVKNVLNTSFDLFSLLFAETTFFLWTNDGRIVFAKSFESESTGKKYDRIRPIIDYDEGDETKVFYTERYGPIVLAAVEPKFINSNWEMEEYEIANFECDLKKYKSHDFVNLLEQEEVLGQYKQQYNQEEDWIKQQLDTIIKKNFYKPIKSHSVSERPIPLPKEEIHYIKAVYSN